MLGVIDAVATVSDGAADNFFSSYSSFKIDSKACGSLCELRLSLFLFRLLVLCLDALHHDILILFITAEKPHNSSSSDRDELEHSASQEREMAMFSIYIFFCFSCFADAKTQTNMNSQVRDRCGCIYF